MIVESSVTSLSWLPSELMRGIVRAAFDAGLMVYDTPPPDHLDDVEALRRAARFRFANHLSASATVEDGVIRALDVAPTSGCVTGLTKLLGGAIRIPSLRVPDLVTTQISADGTSAFVRQSAGARTMIPLPRVAHGRPRLASPLVWTTLELTFTADSAVHRRVVGASDFPRHWIYDHGGTFVEKVALTDSREWMRMDAAANPWHGVDGAAPTMPVESPLERRLSVPLMAADHEVRQIAAGDDLFRQGDEGTSVALLLDGVVEVIHDGSVLVELGPGAVLGERALLEGTRTATVRAVTNLIVVLVDGVSLPPADLERLVSEHHREDRLEA